MPLHRYHAMTSPLFSLVFFTRTMDFCPLLPRCRYMILSLFAPFFKCPYQNRLDTAAFAKIFTILKEVAPCDPTVVMADGDGAIRAAVTEVFPDALKAMCWFHCKQASKRNLGNYPSCPHLSLFALFFSAIKTRKRCDQVY